ncbi:MAG: STAS domain-containing protein [Deltaproteobacteria bacterium]|nr:STAS domain-containing protein [Deltaproteobacteria bacterium]
MRKHDNDAVPVILLWGQLLVVLQRELSDSDAVQLTHNVLHTLRRTGARGLAIDASGLRVMDSHLCSVLARLAAAVRLMGARCVLCGMGAEVAMTLQAMGIELENLDSAHSLEDALEHLGIHATRIDESAKAWELLDALLERDHRARESDQPA